jgi:hypothetical protein
VIRLGLCSLLALYCAASSFAADPVARLPGDLNAVMVIDVAAVYRSPVAQKEQWSKRAAESFFQQEMLIPPTTRRVTVGAQLDVDGRLHPLREFAVLEFTNASPLDRLGEWGWGQVETLGTQRGMPTPRGGYVVSADASTWLVARPGGRQAAQRWARQPVAAVPAVSDYLSGAAKQALEATPIVLALDLADVVNAADAAEVLQSLAVKNATPQQIEQWSQQLAGARGVTALVSLSPQRHLRLSADFAAPTASLAPIARPLAEEVLRRMGASLDDAAQWKVAAVDKSLVVEGDLSPNGLKRLLSVMQPPSVAAAAAPVTTATTGNPQSDMARTIAASKTYYKGVDHELDDLRATLKKTRDNHALWFERSGRKIDDLPMMNVDDDLLTFGARVSNSLRYQSESLRGANMRVGVRKAETGANAFGTTVGYYGVVAPYSTSFGNSAAITNEENMSAKTVQFSEWKEIEDGLVAIRRNLTKKYGVEF